MGVNNGCYWVRERWIYSGEVNVGSSEMRSSVQTSVAKTHSLTARDLAAEHLSCSLSESYIHMLFEIEVFVGVNAFIECIMKLLESLHQIENVV